ncbi:uncharacterized protein LOC130893867 [Diorhabda carinulata]|uniref:uncharacterized protein LOC130893867 n=1 Tax=Diorhabda carinulata TaxID=1163345 RepID=UPI0025A192BE|nr:uncharacterized protein LOC130893867 [Diorhabda carinulata]XP_057656271.1 uncharacterized protein LOC130893867 [Diorhabda carinulata]
MVNMTSGTNLVVLRLSVFLGMVAVTFTLLYLTPAPDQRFKSCDRPCHDLDWPMICRFKLTIEKLPTSVICQECQNSTDCPFCASQIDLPLELITANRKLPAPIFQVCHNDILVINVINKLQGQSITMHWRGQTNREAPFMDGVPLITQCPINAYTTFQYRFRASSPGTHSYHAFADSDRFEGLYGAIVVRKSEKIEPNIHHYDIDDKNQILVLSQTRQNILINGVGPNSSDLTKFVVHKGARSLFRLIHSSGSGCPITFSVDNHVVNVVTVDADPIVPLEVSSIKLNKGETVDFVLEANQDPGSYFITAKSQCESNSLVGKAIIAYKGAAEGTNLKKFDYVGDLRKFDTGFCGGANGKVCVGDIRPAEGMEGSLRQLDVDKRFYLGFDAKSVSGTRKNILSTNQYKMNNISFTFPPAPVLTQPYDVPLDSVCNESHLPDRCHGKHCDCVHLEHIPLGSRTELVLIDQGGNDEEYIFHLHGYQFYVVGYKIPKYPLTKSEVEKLDENFDFIKRNLQNPVRKHTIRVPKNGIVVIRFLANNPGFWLLRDENAQGWTRGMDILFQVGDTGDIPAPPTNFPTCGNFVGPDFFLL